MKTADLSIKLVADIADLQRKMLEAQRSVSGSMANISKAANLAKGALAGLAAGLSVGAFGAFIKSSIDAADRLNDLSVSTGIAVDKLAGLQYAAKMSGTDIEGLASTLNKLSVNIGNNAQKFAALGVTARDPVEALKQLATVFSQIQDPQLRAAFGAEALGKSWASAAPLLDEGADGIQRLIEEGQKLNGITPKMAQQAAEFNDELDKMAMRAQGAALAIAGPLIKAFNALNDRVKSVIESVGEYFGLLEKKQEPMGTQAFPLTEQRAVTDSQIRAFIDGNKQANEAAKELAKFVEELNSLRNRLLGEANGIDADFQKNLAVLKRGFDSGRVSLEQYQELVEIYIRSQKFFQNQQKEQAEIVRQFEQDGKDAAELREKERLDREKVAQSVADLVDAMEFEVSALKMTNAERETAIKLRELERTGIDQNSEAFAAAAERIKQAVIDKEAIEQSIKQQQEYAKQWEKITDQVGFALTNSLMEGGKNAAEYLKNLFKTLILRPLMEPLVRGGVGAMLGAMGMAAPGAAAATSGGSGGLGSIGSAAGLLSMGTAFGAGMAASFSSMMAAGVSGWATAAGSLIGTGAASGIAAGLGMIAAPLAVAALAFEPLFGRKLKSAGIQGDFGGEAGFSGMNFEFYKGGLLRSDKTKRRPLDPAVQNALAQQFFAVQGSMYGMANALGGVATSVDGYTKSIKVNLKGLSEEKAQEKLQQVFEDITEEMGAQVLRQVAAAEMRQMGMLNRGILINEITLQEYIEQFQRVGETSGQTLQRLSTAVSVVNQAFDSLGYTLMQASLSGADLASKITEAFGGVENFSKSIDAFYQTFYSEQERTTILTRQLSETFGNLNLVLPTTREAYRALVESFDLTSEKGRSLFATLVQLSPTFAAVTKSAEELRQQAIDAARSVTDNALAALEMAIDKQKQLAEISRQAAQESVENLRSVFDVLSSAINGLTGQSGGMTAAAGRAFIEQALSNARASGYLPDAGMLSDAIEAATEGLERTAYASSFEAARDRLVLAGRLSELRSLTGDQLSIAEQQLQAAEAQLVALDAQLGAARTQIEVMRGVDVSVQSVAAAMASLASAIQAERSAMTATVAAAAPVIAAQAAQPKPTPQTMSYSQAVQKLKAQGIPYGGQAGSTLRTAQDISNFLGATILSSGGSLVAAPQFAAGGMHMGGLRLVGENGPELEATGPARYYSSADTMAMLGGGSEVATELRQLREENRAQSRALVGLQNRMTKLLEQWDGDGIPATRDVTA